MRQYADLLETVTPAASTAAERNLTTLAKVKAALKITDADSDAAITDLLPRVSKDIENYCRLAKDAAGAVATLARETLRATWFYDVHPRHCRGPELLLPWRLPVFSIDSVVENGATLTANDDYMVMSSRAGRLRRFIGESPVEWDAGKIVVTFKAGFASVMSANIEAEIEAAAIEQIKSMLYSADRDPNIRSESSPDLAAVTYSVTGGDVMGASVLLPSVRDRLAGWRNPAL